MFVWVDLHVSLCGRQNPERDQAISLVYPPVFCKLGSSASLTNKIPNGILCGFSKRSFSVTIQNESLVYTNTSFSQ